VRYERVMRERAKRERKGLFTIGYVRRDGASWHLQGLATNRIIELVDGLMAKLLSTTGRTSATRSKP